MVELKVGLEIHGYVFVENKTKLFCDCAIDQEAKPNTTVCPICTGQPGSKPMKVNKEAFDKIIAIGSLFSCEINERLLFQRKHYSWPDLPNNFQKTISGSYSTPVGVEGEFMGIGIEEVHLEEDPGKWDPDTGNVDYNRCGYPLVEIVTKPDFTSIEQVGEWLKRLITTLSYIKAVNKNAGIKCDVNVSIGPKFNRVEIKNVNSIKAILKCIEFEMMRQEMEIKEGKEITPQTRRGAEDGTTVFMRSKESAADYMFIPDPDLPAMYAKKDYVGEIAKDLPEKPHEKIEKFVKKGVDGTDAQIIANEIILAELFEKVAMKIDPILAARWFRRDIMRVINLQEKDLDEIEFNVGYIIDLLKLVEGRKVSDPIAKELLEKLIEEPFDVKEHVSKEGLEIVQDSSELDGLCKTAIEQSGPAIEDYRAGSEKALNNVVGKVMAATKGKADPTLVKEMIKKMLDE